MIVYTLRSKHFTLGYDKANSFFFAICSGTARGYKVKVRIDQDNGKPYGARVTTGETTLRDSKQLKTYIKLLQDAALFQSMIQNIELDKLEPINRRG